MLVVPPLLEDLLAAGRWPRDEAEARRQNLESRVPRERVQALAPEEETIFLVPPPFRTVRKASRRESFWTEEMADPRGIDFDATLILGDFGMGSDSPIVLDYRIDPSNPRVLRLHWSARGTSNRWVVLAPDFPSLVVALAL